MVNDRCFPYTFILYMYVPALKAAKVSDSSIANAVLTVGNNATQVSFEEWALAYGVEDSATLVVAVTSLGVLGSAAGQ